MSDLVINYDKLKNWSFDPVEQTYTTKDSILYALGLGFGSSPLDEGDLHFTFEEEGFSAVPTMAAVLGTPGFWVRDPKTGVDWKQVLHGEQSIELHKPLPAEATIIAQNSVQEVIDKGEGRGALIYTKREISDKASEELLATCVSTTFARANGGFGGPPIEQPKPHVDLSPIRRSKPATRITDGSQDGWLRGAYSARTLHTWGRGTRRSQDLLRQ